ncbi:MAG TPA: hypothetical protein PK609_00590 [Candidatus Paceibacterota bacterium]|nr:hypothetical protein [Candidatus Paceibacterota bacterium]
MRRLALVHLAIAGTLLALVLGAYGFWYVSVGKASATATALSSDIKMRGQDTARVAAAKDALALLTADEESIRAYRIREAEIVPFLGSLESTGTTLGSQVEVVSVGSEPIEGKPGIRLSLKITGSFDSVLRTLGAFEYGPYDGTVENVTLDTNSGEAASVWTATATLRIGTEPASP